MLLSDDLSPSAWTVYAQLLDAAMAVNATRAPRDLPGSFTTKRVRGKIYHYFQYTEPCGVLRQLYVGPDTETVRSIVVDRCANADRRGQSLKALARAAWALGCQKGPPMPIRVIERLADYGFFRTGAVLTGGQAFSAIGNMLGVRWKNSPHPQDGDRAQTQSNVAIVLPRDHAVDARTMIDSLAEGLLPMSALGGPLGASALKPPDPEFRLDFLTPRTPAAVTVDFPRLGIPLQSLRGVEYLLDDVQKAVVFSGSRVALVHVPAPQRYAVYKVLVSVERSTQSATHLWQAASIFEVMLRDAGELVEAAVHACFERGPEWRQRWERGINKLRQHHPDLAGQVFAFDRQRAQGTAHKGCKDRGSIRSFFAGRVRLLAPLTARAIVRTST